MPGAAGLSSSTPDLLLVPDLQQVLEEAQAAVRATPARGLEYAAARRTGCRLGLQVDRSPGSLEDLW